MIQVSLLGGYFDGWTSVVEATPPRIEIAGTTYLRMDDPDTGEFLGGYTAVQSCNRKRGQRDVDGHGWVTTMFAFRWRWRCHYCGKKVRSVEKPDVKGPLPW